MAVGMGMAMPMGAPVIVAVGAGMGGGRHPAMLYYNITEVHPSPCGRLPKQNRRQSCRRHVLQANGEASKDRRQLDAAALLHFNGLSGQAFENSSST
jgi:hypothetical protein